MWLYTVNGDVSVCVSCLVCAEQATNLHIMAVRSVQCQCYEVLFIRAQAPQSRSLISFDFITGNSSLEPLLKGLFAQIHVNLS